MISNDVYGVERITVILLQTSSLIIYKKEMTISVSMEESFADAHRNLERN